MSFRELKNIISAFEVSEPVFKIVAASGWSGSKNEIQLGEHIGKKASPQADTNDPLSVLACKFFKEEYSRRNRKFEVRQDVILSESVKEIRAYLLNFINKEMSEKKKNFAESKMGKWYSRYACGQRDLSTQNATLLDQLISLYIYMQKSFSSENDEIHRRNAVAVMTALYEKNFKEDDIRVNRRRRRRR